jgi:hypothetical protein
MKHPLFFILVLVFSTEVMVGGYEKGGGVDEGWFGSQVPCSMSINFIFS